LSDKHFCVTGGCGFIGSHIVEELVKQGHRVTVYDNLSTGSLSNLDGFADRVSFIEGDICNYFALEKALAGVTHVFHEAAVVSVFDSVERPEFVNEVNITGTLNVLRAAKSAGVKRVVIASTCAIYGNNPMLPKIETMLPEPASPYAVTKITDEYYMHIFSELYDLETVCLRYFNVYGPRQDPSSSYSGVISIFASCALSGKTPLIFGDGLQTRDFVYVKDVVQANLLAMDTAHVDTAAFNVGTGQATSLLDLLGAMGDAAGVTFDPVFKEERPGDVKHSLADISLATEKLGYRPSYTLNQGTSELLDFLRTTQ